MAYFSSSWATLTNYALASAFWSMSPIYMTRFWTLLKTATIYHLFTSNQILVWFKPLPLNLDFNQHHPFYPCFLISIPAHLSIWLFFSKIQNLSFLLPFYKLISRFYHFVFKVCSQIKLGKWQISHFLHFFTSNRFEKILPWYLMREDPSEPKP
jgi:hypothetical protein